MCAILTLITSDPLCSLWIPGCWACTVPADRYGGKGGHPRCHPGREWRSGPDCHLCGHLRGSSDSTRSRKQLHDMARRVLMEQQRSTSACSWTCNVVRMQCYHFFLKKNLVNDETWERSIFLFCFHFFPLVNCWIHHQPDVAKWKCSQRTSMILPKSTVFFQVVFITRRT